MLTAKISHCHSLIMSLHKLWTTGECTKEYHLIWEVPFPNQCWESLIPISSRICHRNLLLTKWLSRSWPSKQPLLKAMRSIKTTIIRWTIMICPITREVGWIYLTTWWMLPLRRGQTTNLYWTVKEPSLWTNKPLNLEFSLGEFIRISIGVHWYPEIKSRAISHA